MWWIGGMGRREVPGACVVVSSRPAHIGGWTGGGGGLADGSPASAGWLIGLPRNVAVTEPSVAQGSALVPAPRRAGTLCRWSGPARAPERTVYALLWLLGPPSRFACQTRGRRLQIATTSGRAERLCGTPLRPTTPSGNLISCPIGTQRRRAAPCCTVADNICKTRARFSPPSYGTVAPSCKELVEWQSGCGYFAESAAGLNSTTSMCDRCTLQYHFASGGWHAAAIVAPL